MRYRATVMDEEDGNVIDCFFADNQCDLLYEVDRQYGQYSECVPVRVIIQAVVNNTCNLWEVIDVTHDLVLDKDAKVFV